MNVQVVGCSHHSAPIEFRERLAFGLDQTRDALEGWRRAFPGVEVVLLSTCNRVEIYAAAMDQTPPDMSEVAKFLAAFHGLEPAELDGRLYLRRQREAVCHLFAVASSLDSMVLGEPQITSQVKQAYQLAAAAECVGPVLHGAFQAALHAARRVASETTIHQRRVSVPSVAVGDFGRRIFERFDDKHVLVIGAGQMAEETLLYLRDEGVHQLTVINRNAERGAQLAARWRGRALDWEQLEEALATADLVVSTTGAGEPIVDAARFRRIERLRHGRPLFILDLAVPRDFEPSIGQRPDVYLYSIDDLQAVCEQNRRQRDRELPAAQRIIDEEADRFLADMYHQSTGPVVTQLREKWRQHEEQELRRLFNKLPELDDRAKEEIRRSFDRLVNKLLHPPLESLRKEARQGIPAALLEALSKLFQLKD